MNPVSRRHSTASSGPSSIGTPRASSTSAAPHSEVTARLPCLATLAPAAAATSAAPEEMLKVSGPPPPVPTTSTSSSRSSSVKGSGVDPLAHHLHKAGQFRRLFAARGQHGQQRRSLHLRHVAGENLFQDGGRLLASQCRAILGQRLQIAPSKKAISLHGNGVHCRGAACLANAMRPLTAGSLRLPRIRRSTILFAYR